MKYANVRSCFNVVALSVLFSLAFLLLGRRELADWLVVNLLIMLCGLLA